MVHWRARSGRASAIGPMKFWARVQSPAEHRQFTFRSSLLPISWTTRRYCCRMTVLSPEEEFHCGGSDQSRNRTGLQERDVPDYIEVDHHKMTAKLARIPLLN